MRPDGWEKRLQEYLQNVGPFEWGANDCCMFSANAVLAMTGKDYAQPYRGYKTAKGALSRLKDIGVEGLATQTWGQPKAPAYAQRGDVILYDCGKGDALGICTGDKIAVIGHEGLVILPMSDCLKAWSV
jgi:hypothetical protein